MSLTLLNKMSLSVRCNLANTNIGLILPRDTVSHKYSIGFKDNRGRDLAQSLKRLPGTLWLHDGTSSADLLFSVFFPHSKQCPMAYIPKGRSVHYPVYGIVHIKYPLLSTEKNGSRSGGSGFSVYLCGSLQYTRPLYNNLEKCLRSLMTIIQRVQLDLYDDLCGLPNVSIECILYMIRRYNMIQNSFGWTCISLNIVSNKCVCCLIV